jgi:TonB family protein
METQKLTSLIAGCVIFLPAFVGAQEVTRRVQAFSWHGTDIDIVAADQQVRLFANSGADHIEVWAERREVRAFADTIEALLLSKQTVSNPRDELNTEVSMRPDLSPVDDVIFAKKVSVGRSQFSLFFSDQYVVNRALVDVTPGQARLFIKALRQAVKDAGELSLSHGPDTASVPYSASAVDSVAVPDDLSPGDINAYYPESLRSRRISGEVELEFVVNSDGRVLPSTIRVKKSTDQAFSDEARLFVRSSTYKPAKIHGVAVDQVVHRIISFPAPSQ